MSWYLELNGNQSIKTGPSNKIRHQWILSPCKLFEVKTQNGEKKSAVKIETSLVTEMKIKDIWIIIKDDQ